MNDTLQQATSSRSSKHTIRTSRSPRRDFIEVLRDEIARGEYLTEQRIARTVDALAPIVVGELQTKGAA